VGVDGIHETIRTCDRRTERMGRVHDRAMSWQPAFCHLAVGAGITFTKHATMKPKNFRRRAPTAPSGKRRDARRASSRPSG